MNWANLRQLHGRREGVDQRSSGWEQAVTEAATESRSRDGMSEQRHLPYKAPLIVGLTSV